MISIYSLVPYPGWEDISKNKVQDKPAITIWFNAINNQVDEMAGLPLKEMVSD